MLLARNASFRAAGTQHHWGWQQHQREQSLQPCGSGRCGAHGRSTPAAAQPHHRFTRVCGFATPARAFATASGDDRTKEKEPSRWEKLQQLFREHGVAFGALYVGANVVTFIPIFGALTIGGVDGPELILWAADQLEITYDLSFIKTIHKDLVNAFIALGAQRVGRAGPAAGGHRVHAARELAG